MRKKDIQHLRKESEMKNGLIDDQKKELARLRDRVEKLEKNKT